jgi:hypothetical protein
LFRRLELSAEETTARIEIETNAQLALDEFLADADEIEVGDVRHGMQSFAATIRLDKEEKPAASEKRSWWKRILGKS